MKQKFKKYIILIFGRSLYNFLYYIYTFKITHVLNRRKIKYIRIKKILSNKNKLFYKNKVLFTVREYGDSSGSRLDDFFSQDYSEFEIVEWIKRFDKNSNFLDIGANIGTYSLLAAKRNHNVISVEPESLNFAMLNLNIYDNKLNNNITAYPVSIDQFNHFSHLNIYQMGWGNAMHSFDTDIIINNQKKESQFLQGSIGIRLDDFLEQIKFTPDYVKIDVDGNELRVIKGSPNLLKSKNIKSIVIEINPENIDEKKQIIDIFEQNSFILDKKHSDYANYIFDKFGSCE